MTKLLPRIVADRVRNLAKVQVGYKVTYGRFYRDHGECRWELCNGNDWSDLTIDGEVSITITHAGIVVKGLRAVELCLAEVRKAIDDCPSDSNWKNQQESLRAVLAVLKAPQEIDLIDTAHRCEPLNPALERRLLAHLHIHGPREWPEAHTTW